MNNLAIFLSSILFFVMVTTSQAQTIRRCNNNPGVTGVNIYTTIQAAHDAAANGDVIYVEPSINPYGNLDCTKRLTIIGNGYFLIENALISDTRASVIGAINFNSGSANSSISGISINSGFTISNVSSITVTRCMLNQPLTIIGSSLSGINITQCFLYYDLVGGSATNCTITNNIIGGRVTAFTNSIIANNTFYTETIARFLSNCTIVNNIFRSGPCNSCTQYLYFDSSNNGNTISNNIVAYTSTPGSTGASSSIPAGNGNINGIEYTNLFLTAEPVIDKQFQLKAGSPAIGVGTGGTNVGAFGGSTPYVLAGIPPYPIITDFSTSGAGNVTTPLQVSITVRSNN